MDNEIISYMDMCQREGASLQRGMNFEHRDTHSVILMSVRRSAPYSDSIAEDGSTIIYEGHDVPRTPINPNPKILDQAIETPKGTLTQNGKFLKAALSYKNEKRPPERVLVYEKIHNGIWSYNGVFHLVDGWQEFSNGRKVYKFKLIAVEGEEDLSLPIPKVIQPRRIIPSDVKREVWERDHGKCAKCGSSIDLHFDHILPFSKGGSSNTAENIQLLCGKHNLEKRDKIE